MARLTTDKISLAGVCCALPGEGHNIFDIGRPYFDEETIRKTTSPIGVETLFRAPDDMTASDICYKAADRLIDGLGWERGEIGALIFITQTPDYRMPATSCILADRLGLPEGCVTFDINLGCSAFVNGYFLAANLIAAGSCDKALLLIGDTLREYVSPEDKGLTFIISDGGSATAFERSSESRPTSFLMKSDGSGYGNLIIPAGASRMPSDSGTCVPTDDGSGSRRSEDDMYMDGMGVFTFAVKQVPLLIGELAECHGISKDAVDLYLFHQANAYMLKYIAKRAGVPMDKVMININKYGNTNGSTIPFLLADLSSELSLGGSGGKEIMMAGFGVGLSWGGVCMNFGGMDFAEIINV
ncbi:MAG: ketoacyl-ACP synthase III [Clostridiales Family XIII bacterium]|jgi:3-oxoacyl-[acyl-carrier-protein] synthase-3|nr:ketoacyl-ACP synthase III [Clostridiales Family XIII bacterium]